MKFDFPKKIRSGYLAVFLLLLLCYFLSLSSFISLREQNKSIDHTREVITELGSLNSNLKDAEISWQEYLLSKEKTYLNAYRESRALVDSVYDVLSISVDVNPGEKRRLESMHTMIEKKYRLLDEELDLFDKNHFLVNDSILSRELHNKVLIDSIGSV